MTYYGPDEWLWAMFEPTPTWPNFDFGQLFIWIGTKLVDLFERTNTKWG